jgi:hypothetical protein
MDLYPEFCAACVPDETPEDFDKRRLNVMCFKKEQKKRPLWWMRKDYEMS